MKGVQQMTPPPIETVSVERKDGRFVVVVRRGEIEATGQGKDEQTALFAARSAWGTGRLRRPVARRAGCSRYGRTKKTRGRDAHASRRGRRRYGGCADL
ncbi:MAG: hypothetical protein M5U26_03955 [Planctomycetota bacterium]|nr:hypothetical protein [Planctomycetota bacterium]